MRNIARVLTVVMVATVVVPVTPGASAAPRARWIAFAMTTGPSLGILCPCTPPGGQSLDIHIAKEDGSQLKRLTSDLADDFGPAWSPDGKRIAFWSRRDGSEQLYVMNADGSGQRRVTNNPQADNPHVRFPPDWSPDGRRIAVELNQGMDCNCTNIFVIGADGRGLRRVTTGRSIDNAPDWSRDGKRIAFSSQFRASDSEYPEVYVTEVDRPHAKRLTFNQSYEWSPEWSPDGRRIAFQSNRPGGPGARFDIYTMRTDGSAPRKLTSTADNELPSWSADGADIIFQRDPDGQLFGGVGCFPEQCPVIALGGPQPADVWRMRADGSRPTKLISNAMEPVFRAR